jgi:WD40 repeat protein
MPLQRLHDYGQLDFVATSPDGHWLSIYPDDADLDQQAIFAPATNTRLPLPTVAEGHSRLEHTYTPDNAYLLTIEGQSSLYQPETVIGYAIADNLREVMRFASGYAPRLLKLLSPSPDSTFVALPDGTASREMGIAIHRIQDGAQVARIDGGVAIGFIDNLRWLPDNTLLLFDALGNLLHFDVETQRLLAQMKINGRVLDTAFAPTGNAVAVFTTNADPREPDPDAKQWLDVVEFPTGTKRFRHEVPRADFVMSVSFSPDGKLLAVAYRTATVQILDATTGETRERLTLDGPYEQHGQAHFLTDGTLLVTDGLVRIYSLT